MSGDGKPIVCSNCRYVRHGLVDCCDWERYFYPPPVYRQRTWGQNPPQTAEDTAKICRHFQPALPENTS